jgi:hypothetical protein
MYLEGMDDEDVSQALQQDFLEVIPIETFTQFEADDKTSRCRLGSLYLLKSYACHAASS